MAYQRVCCRVVTLSRGETRRDRGGLEPRSKGRKRGDKNAAWVWLGLLSTDNVRRPSAPITRTQHRQLHAPTTFTRHREKKGKKIWLFCQQDYNQGRRTNYNDNEVTRHSWVHSPRRWDRGGAFARSARAFLEAADTDLENAKESIERAKGERERERELGTQSDNTSSSPTHDIFFLPLPSLI